MTELAVRANGWGLIERDSTPAPSRQDLAEWVKQARDVATVAEMLCRTSFVPKAFQGKPAECAAAILAGQEMGMAPMAALRAIDVIEGKPGLSALGLRALVQSKGHEIWVHESTATRAIVKGRRKGSEKVETSTWTIERARQMGLTGKKNWKEQPTNMLLARATSECARLIAADALLGMPYSTEELEDGADMPVPVSGAPVEAKPARRTARRAQAAPPAEPTPNPEPELEEPAEQHPYPEAETVTERALSETQQSEPPITEAQIKRLHVAFGTAGIKDRDQKMAVIYRVIGRVVESSKELTKREAARVIDHLEAPPSAVEEPPAVEEPGFDYDWPDVTQPGGAR